MSTRSHDLVITGGRVIDPETGLDAVRNIGIRDGSIVAVSTDPLQGKATIDAFGAGRSGSPSKVLDHRLSVATKGQGS